LGDILKCMEPNQLALLSAIFAITISDGLTPDEIFAVAGFIVAVGDMLVAIGAQQVLLGTESDAVYCPACDGCGNNL
jgi:hypothetical protein